MGGQRRVAAQSEGLTDGKWSSLSLILRQADVPSPCVAGCWPGESQAAAEMKKLESSSGGKLVIWCPAQEQECDAEWAEGGERERGSLCSLLQRPILTAKAGENLDQKPPSSYLICVGRENSSSQDVFVRLQKRSPSHRDRCSPSFIHLSNYTGDKREGTATKICNLSFSETCQNFTAAVEPPHLSYLAQVESCRQRRPFEGCREPEMRGSPACRGISHVEVPAPPRCN